MENKYILESLASDLKRVALGLHRGSKQMSQRFLKEALKRKSEVDVNTIDLYIKKILNHIDKNIDAENALMFSTLIQNYSQSKKFYPSNLE
ncbi:MAG: hypothetical protein Q7R95_08060 [bacterium]|nr:hypothetical protein [bacterium]